jgi:hypothetical protein
MQARNNVKDFVQQAQRLLHMLRHKGHELSDVDLHMLTTQLHLLEIEATNLQTFKKLRPTDRAA